MTINSFIEELNNLNISCSEEQLKLLEEYYKFLIDYNSHTNLTTITNKEDVYLKHFYDSLTIFKEINTTDSYKILDIGSGAGFPGIILKIFNPNIKLYLMDSNNKKTTFLILLVDKLQLNNVTIINDRAELFINNHRDEFDIVVSRAVAKTAILIELSVPYLKVDGKLIIMKASNEVLKEELDNCHNIYNLLNCKLEKVNSFNLPTQNSERNLVVIRKTGFTDSKYPRSYDKILKNSLK